MLKFKYLRNFCDLNELKKLELHDAMACTHFPLMLYTYRILLI